MTYKMRAIPVMAKFLSLWRTTTNPQQQESRDEPKYEAAQTSSNTSEPKEGIPPSKEVKLLENEPEKDEDRVKRRRVPYVLAVLVACVALFIMFSLYPHDQEVLQESGQKVIMLWNEDPRKMPKGSAHMECGCVITSRRKDYESAVDAIVFNAHRHYTLKYLHRINRTRNFLSVFAARDSLGLAKEPPLPPKANDWPAFNLTMTYRLDSQLVWSEYYFSLHNQDSRLNSFRAPSKHYSDDMPAYEMERLKNQTRKKNSLAMYLMYEVEETTFPQSLYLKELRKYVHLDAHQSCKGFEFCLDYHFMLIFDSTACPDYVPTQMYEAMYKFIVPVLIGGGGNLEKLVPPQSYISSRDFAKPKDLVAYMKHLMSTPEEYKRYFWWHSLYKLRRTAPPYCQLCLLLKQPQKKRRIETSFGGWWNKYKCPKFTSFL